MSLFNLVHPFAGQRAPRRRIAVARHAKQSDPLGWILLGFLLGAGAAITVMMHANLSVRRMPEPLKLLTPPAAAPKPPPPPSAPAAPASAVTPSKPAAVAPAPATAMASSGPGLIAPGPPDAQVEEDAAAAGMTSQPPKAPPAVKSAEARGLY